MWSEIGSDFWQYTLAGYENKEMFFWSDKEYSKKYLKSGRNAIKALCRYLSDYKKKVMLPVYTCETVILPFIEEGWEVCYYPLNRDLTINESLFIQKFDVEIPSVILLHSYFGFNTIESETPIEYCKNRGAIIVEDMTQSLFSEHHIQCADYYVASFRKFLAIPNGGVIISKKKLRDIKIEPSDNRIDEIALNAFDLKADYFKGETEEKKVAFREKYQLLADLIVLNAEIQRISMVSEKIIFSCDKDKVNRQRQSNYKMLLKAIKKIKYITPVLNLELDGCTPLYFPIYVEHREKLQAYLKDYRIYCPIIWRKPPQLSVEDKETNYMYKHMLCIPIDQRYGVEEMNKIIDVLNEYK